MLAWLEKPSWNIVALKSGGFTQSEMILVRGLWGGDGRGPFTFLIGTSGCMEGMAILVFVYTFPSTLHVLPLNLLFFSSLCLLCLEGSMMETLLVWWWYLCINL